MSYDPISTSKLSRCKKISTIDFGACTYSSKSLSYASHSSFLTSPLTLPVSPFPFWASSSYTTIEGSVPGVGRGSLRNSGS